VTFFVVAITFRIANPTKEGPRYGQIWLKGVTLPIKIERFKTKFIRWPGRGLDYIQANYVFDLRGQNQEQEIVPPQLS
jgi:hypothetical protein